MRYASNSIVSKNGRISMRVFYLYNVIAGSMVGAIIVDLVCTAMSKMFFQTTFKFVKD